MSQKLTSLDDLSSITCLSYDASFVELYHIANYELTRAPYLTGLDSSHQEHQSGRVRHITDLSARSHGYLLQYQVSHARVAFFTAVTPEREVILFRTE